MKNFAIKLLLCAILAGTSSFDVSGMKRKFEEDEKKEIKEDKKEDENLDKTLQAELISDMKKLSKKTYIKTIRYFTLEQEQILDLINMLKNFNLNEITDILQEVYITNREVLKNISNKISYQEAVENIAMALTEVKKKLMGDRSAMLKIISEISPNQFIAILNQLTKNTAETVNLFEKDGFEALASINKKTIFKLTTIKDKIEKTNKVTLDDIIFLICNLNLYYIL